MTVPAEWERVAKRHTEMLEHPLQRNLMQIYNMEKKKVIIASVVESLTLSKDRYIFKVA